MSAGDSTYNGWSNYPTWAVNLWLSNDEGLYSATEETLAQAGTAYRKAQALRGFVENLNEVVAVTERASFVSDLLGYALAEVDWVEIVEAWQS